MKNHLLFAFLIICILLAFLLVACGSTSSSSNQTSAAYDTGYSDGYSAGKAEIQHEWDEWWDEYYGDELLDRYLADGYIKDAFMYGLALGYDAREKHYKWPFTEENEMETYADYGYTYGDRLFDLCNDVYSEVFP